MKFLPKYSNIKSIQWLKYQVINQNLAFNRNKLITKIVNVLECFILEYSDTNTL